MFLVRGKIDRWWIISIKLVVCCFIQFYIGIKVFFSKRRKSYKSRKNGIPVLTHLTPLMLLFFLFLIVCFTSYFVFSIAVLPHSPGVVYYHLLLRRETRILGVAPFSFRIGSESRIFLCIGDRNPIHPQLLGSCGLLQE